MVTNHGDVKWMVRKKQAQERWDSLVTALKCVQKDTNYAKGEKWFKHEEEERKMKKKLNNKKNTKFDANT